MNDLAAAAEAARGAQPLWSLVPVTARARYIRRAAVAMLDELDELSLRLAGATGWPRAHLVMSELLPAARGLRALADDGPRALADRRVSSRVAQVAGRHTRLVQSPVGVVGLRGPSASPWAEPALETAAALLAGNGVLLGAGAPPAAQRLRAVFLRAGVPGELITPVPADSLDAVCARVVDLPRPGRRGILLVLPGAPRAKVVEAALWAAFGRHAAEAGRLVTVAGAIPGLVASLIGGAAALRVGDPRAPDTDVGPLAYPGDLAALQAQAGDGRRTIEGLEGVFWAPTVIGGVSPEDALFRTPPPAPVLAVVEVPDSETAIRLAAEGEPVSVWARDPAQGERVARRLPAQVTWVGRHGVAATDVGVRLARHVVPRQIESRAAWAPGMEKLPAEPDAVTARTALVELRHGRESRRWPALRALARTARRER